MTELSGSDAAEVQAALDSMDSMEDDDFDNERVRALYFTDMLRYYLTDQEEQFIYFGSQANLERPLLEFLTLAINHLLDLLNQRVSETYTINLERPTRVYYQGISLKPKTE